MAASTKVAVTNHLLGQKSYLSRTFSCSKSGFVLQAVSSFMGELFLDASTMYKNGACRAKKCLSTHALSLEKDSLNEGICPYDQWHKLPHSLSWLLEPSDNGIKRHIKKQPREGAGACHLGVIMEWKGVIVEDDDPEMEARVWYLLSLEEEKSFPSDSLLDRIKGMKTEQAISEVLHWSDEPTEIQRLVMRKELIHHVLCGRCYNLRHGVLDFLNTLVDFDIPIAMASDHPVKILQEGIDIIGLQGYFDAIVSAEDFRRGMPEPDMFELAAERLGVPAENCVVFGSTMLTTQAARSAGMSSVAVASRHPVYKLKGADHVVRWLDQLSVVDLKMIANGETRFGRSRWSDMEIVIGE